MEVNSLVGVVMLRRNEEVLESERDEVVVQALAIIKPV
jgi:hypothetical protein